MTTGSVSPAVDSAQVPAPESQASRLLLRPWKHMLVHRGWPTMQYLARTEAHTYAFSVAANAILSFFPFMVLLMWLIRNVFHSTTMYNVVVDLLRDHLPAGQDFVIRNLQSLVKTRQRVKMASLVILLITSTGVFVPLEVAFNRIWGFAKNRSYLGNQIISLALAFACGILALISVAMAAGNELALTFMMRGNENIVFRAATFVALKICATRGQHRHLLPDLLASAQRQDQSQKRTARGGCHGRAVGGRQSFVHQGVALAGFSGGLRAGLLDLSGTYVLGVYFRLDVAGGRTPVI